LVKLLENPPIGYFSKTIIYAVCSDYRRCNTSAPRRPGLDHKEVRRHYQIPISLQELLPRGLELQFVRGNLHLITALAEDGREIDSL
jgi:hypothetical protein